MKTTNNITVAILFFTIWFLVLVWAVKSPNQTPLIHPNEIAPQFYTGKKQEVECKVVDKIHIGTTHCMSGEYLVLDNSRLVLPIFPFRYKIGETYTFQLRMERMPNYDRSN